MHRLRHIIVLLIVGVLGLQSGAMAMHTQLLPAPAAYHAAMVDTPMHGEQHARAAQSDAGDHHSASCAATQSCFLVADVLETALAILRATPVTPAAAAPSAQPSPRPERLLRPPRLPG